MSEVFRVIIEDDYRAGKGFEAIIKQTGIVKVQMAEVGAASQRMAAASEQGMEQMARGIWRVTSLFAVMDMALMRVEVAHNILESSQERLDHATQTYGATSRQATQAARELERVHNYVARSYIRATVSAGSFALQLAIQSNLLKGATAATIGQTIATKAAAAAEWFHNAALATKIILLSALTAGTFALAAAVGAASAETLLAKKGLDDMLESANQLRDVEVGGIKVPLRNPVIFEGSNFYTGEGYDVEDAIDELAKRMRDEYRRRSVE